MVLWNPVVFPEPRASRIVTPALEGLRTELWMGGANTHVGDLVLIEHLREAWLVDVAGDLPEAHRSAAALWLPRVFADMHAEPHNLARLRSLADSLAGALRGGPAEQWWEHPQEPPARLYVMCQQGLNRSGLVMGLLLRSLGVPGDEAVGAISAVRPGALNNAAFARLVRS